MRKAGIWPVALVVAVVIAGLTSIHAAELELPARVSGHPSVVKLCGLCGCLAVVYVYHRDLRSTYGLGFDPRNYDQTEPHFYLGRPHRYLHYVGPEWPMRGCRRTNPSG